MAQGILKWVIYTTKYENIFHSRKMVLLLKWKNVHMECDAENRKTNWA